MFKLSNGVQHAWCCCLTSCRKICLKFAMSASRDSLALSLVDATSAVLEESDYDSDVEFSDSSDESSSDLLPSDAEDELDEALAGFVAESGDSDGEIRHDGDEDEDDDGDGVSDHDDGEPSKGSITARAWFLRFWKMSTCPYKC